VRWFLSYDRRRGNATGRMRPRVVRSRSAAAPATVTGEVLMPLGSNPGKAGAGGPTPRSASRETCQRDEIRRADGVFRDRLGPERRPRRVIPAAVDKEATRVGHALCLSDLPARSRTRGRDASRCGAACRVAGRRCPRGRGDQGRRMPVGLRQRLQHRALRPRPLVLCLWPPRCGAPCRRHPRGRRSLCQGRRRDRALARAPADLPQTVSCPHSPLEPAE
jgi:hypothetical protein